MTKNIHDTFKLRMGVWVKILSLNILAGVTAFGIIFILGKAGLIF